jgi:hypothetical protein
MALYVGCFVIDINERGRGLATIQSFDSVHPIYGRLVTLRYDRPIEVEGKLSWRDHSFIVSRVPAANLEKVC